MKAKPRACSRSRGSTTSPKPRSDPASPSRDAFRPKRAVRCLLRCTSPFGTFEKSRDVRSSVASARETAELLLQVGRLVQAEGYDGELSPAQWMALRFFARANPFSRTPS